MPGIVVKVYALGWSSIFLRLTAILPDNVVDDRAHFNAHLEVTHKEKKTQTPAGNSTSKLSTE